MRYQAVTFAELPGWLEDQRSSGIADALHAFLKSFDVLRETYPGLTCPDGLDCQHARNYFETQFQPFRVLDDDESAVGFFTGYYEPVLAGARCRSDRFSVPLFRAPDDLVSLGNDTDRAATSAAGGLTHARRIPDSDELQPFATREQIERGGLDGQGLELLFLEHPVDVFFLHVQGSGLIELENGDRVRVTYAAKNGHPYTSIGQSLIQDGVFCDENMSLAALTAWLKADALRARDVMWRNRSFIFFEELGDAAHIDQVGVRDVPLTAGCSLAVDTSLHAVGLPVYLVIDGLNDKREEFRRLMVMQDTGSAIRGPVRGDIFYGTGPEAGSLAGQTRHNGEMYVLLPRSADGKVGP